MHAYQMHEWELFFPVTEDDGLARRMRVPGGWLYCVDMGGTDGPAVWSQPVFVSDATGVDVNQGGADVATVPSERGSNGAGR
jgi:hypothetical protein